MGAGNLRPRSRALGVLGASLGLRARVAAVQAAGSTCSSPHSGYPPVFPLLLSSPGRLGTGSWKRADAELRSIALRSGRGQPRSVTVGRELLWLPSVHTEFVCFFVLRFDPVVFHESPPAQDVYPVPFQGGWKHYRFAFK